MGTAKKSILIVDDNKDLLNVLDLVLSSRGWKVDLLPSPGQLVHYLTTKSFDVVLLDMNFKGNSSTGNEGFFWLSEIKKLDPDQTVVMITAYGDIDMAVRSMKNGAVDFIDKAWDQPKILSTLESAWQIAISKRQISKLKSQRSHLSKQIIDQTPVFWGKSRAIKEVQAILEKVSITDAHILILGENGTGKEIIARTIHQKSKRAEEVFISVDMGSIPETLFESEMFGYEKGAFTGAGKAKMGRMVLASGGSFFMDEIGNLSLDLQSKLLRVLETYELIPLGGQKVIPVDFRLITATNRDLGRMVGDSEFREDLYYRLNTICITVPPLRDRREDIFGLANFFLNDFNVKHCKSHTIKKSDQKSWRSIPGLVM